MYYGETIKLDGILQAHMWIKINHFLSPVINIYVKIMSVYCVKCKQCTVDSMKEIA